MKRKKKKVSCENYMWLRGTGEKIESRVVVDVGTGGGGQRVGGRGRGAISKCIPVERADI